METLVMAAAVPLIPRRSATSAARGRAHPPGHEHRSHGRGRSPHPHPAVAGLPLIHVATPRFTRAEEDRQAVHRHRGLAHRADPALPRDARAGHPGQAHDGGPAFFAQERVGIDGTRFRRSSSAPCTPMPRSARPPCSRLSPWRCALQDEGRSPGYQAGQVDALGTAWTKLPQLDQTRSTAPCPWWARGPLLASEVDKYEQHVYRRLRVRPGITGRGECPGVPTWTGTRPSAWTSTTWRTGPPCRTWSSCCAPCARLSSPPTAPTQRHSLVGWGTGAARSAAAGAAGHLTTPIERAPSGASRHLGATDGHVPVISALP
ncbi:hypothetical protein QJS66_07975 [Kocuria rhizophila]|nr:hypothetical protein QJS66_07975 [Kocuria rhizophila]